MARELIGNSANVYGVPQDDGEFAPMVEVILMVTEPVYSVDAAGQFVKQRAVEQVRFHAGPKGLRQLADRLAKLADEAEMQVLGHVTTGDKDVADNGGQR